MTPFMISLLHIPVRLCTLLLTQPHTGTYLYDNKKLSAANQYQVPGTVPGTHSYHQTGTGTGTGTRVLSLLHTRSLYHFSILKTAHSSQPSYIRYYVCTSTNNTHNDPNTG